MKNIFKKYFKKIKKIYKNKTLKIFFVSFLTMIITIAVFVLIILNNKEKIVDYIVHNYISNSPIYNEKPILIEKIEEVPAPIITPEVKEEEATIVSAVKKAKPAVVSIIVSKEVPKYDITYKEEKTKNGDVTIKTPIYTQNGTQFKQVGSGSGFIISEDGMIVTNKHVVDNTNLRYTVMLNSGGEYLASVLARDPVLDVAIIKIESKNLPYLKLADSDTLEVGESVIAIGNALGEFKNTVSAGVISGLSRSLLAAGSGGYKEFLYKVIQTDAAINLGNSGGPLLNINGDVVGINVAVAEDSSNIGFSLPINIVKSIIDQVKKTGKISRPYIGVRYLNINQEVKLKFGLSVDYGVLVYNGATEAEDAVVKGSPAEKAGIKEGDIILSVDGETVNANNDFLSLIRYKKIGDIVFLKILSGGIEKTVSLKLEELVE